MAQAGPRWRLWLDDGAPEALRLLLLDDSRGGSARPALVPSLWAHVAGFLRFPAPLQMVYLLGGRRPGSDGLEECLDSAEVFDWWRGDWVPIPPMSSARVGAAAAVLGRLVVVAGGYCTHATEPLDTVEAFDPVPGRWSMLRPMPTRRYGLALAGVRGRLFAIGGDDGRRVCTANEVYCDHEVDWVQAAPLPKPLAGGKAEMHAGKIYYVGGCDQNEELSAATFVYCPHLDQWDYARIPSTADRLSLRIGRTSFAMGLIGGMPGDSVLSASSTGPPSGDARLIVTGGVSGRPDEFFLTDTELLPLESAASSSAPCDHLHAHGGHTDAAWLDVKSVPPMPQPRSGCRSIVLWPTQQRSFLPWHNLSSSREGARPFVVVLGGETPNEEGLVMRPCPEPIVLDMVGGSWHSSPARPKEELGSMLGEPAGVSNGEHDHFLRAVGKLQTSRVAFAITLAQGLPRSTVHGG